MGVSLALLRVASTLDVMAMAFRALQRAVNTLHVRAEPAVVAVPAVDRAFDVTWHMHRPLCQRARARVKHDGCAPER